LPTQLPVIQFQRNSSGVLQLTFLLFIPNFISLRQFLPALSCSHAKTCNLWQRHFRLSNFNEIHLDSYN